ncbi:hypothetical protein LCGC14_3091440 [marine sediment metagenome]|uniref:Uncharacterized protein n=1 Tax=marine sediment metagenome TaxID=412755 RepID=A0A0F8WZ63_9ZZZZ
MTVMEGLYAIREEVPIPCKTYSHDFPGWIRYKPLQCLIRRCLKCGVMEVKPRDSSQWYLKVNDNSWGDLVEETGVPRN